MNYSIIEEIFYSNRGNFESFKNNEKLSKLNIKNTSLFEKLNVILNDEQKQILQDIWELQAQIESEVQLQYYKEGIKIGLLLGAESLT